MAIYTWHAFLLTEASVSRITHALFQKGFTNISPAFTHGKVSVSDGGPSIVLCLRLSHKDDVGKCHQALVGLLRELDVPFFGCIINDGNGGSRASCGRLPETKKAIKAPTNSIRREPPTLPPGPFGKGGDVVESSKPNVIPFPLPKDDGIIP